MGMQKYRADISETQPDTAIVWRANWIGGQPLAKIENCRLVGLYGDVRATVFITSEPDTFFSIPAVCSYKGCRMRGYVSRDEDNNLVFHHCYY